MTMNLLRKMACCGLFLLVLPFAHASDSDKTAAGKLLIDKSYLVPAQILPPAPEFESSKGKAELLDIKTILSRVTPKERELAAKDAVTKNVSFFADTIKGFDIESLPETKALFNQVRYTEDYEAKVFKNYFMRKRPYVTDSTIVTCVAPEEGGEYASYPSGHATMGYSMGIILANLIPERSSVILDRANLYAENRMLCGVHHRSDIIAGQVLGSLVAIQLMQNMEFQKMMQAAKQGLLRAGLAQ
jgi:acid phosphatase (class A)